MKRLLVVCLFVPFILVGCQKSTEEADLDEQAIVDMMGGSEWFDLTGHFEGTPVDDSGSTDTTYFVKDSIVPILWGRRITGHPNSEVGITITGDSAFVSFTIHTVGTLNILGWDPDTGWVGLQKPLDETSQLSAVYKRTGTATDVHRGWELTDISGAEGASDSVCTVRIDSVRIQSTSYQDTVLTDPLDIIPIENTMTFTPGEQVTLTVYTNDSTLRLFLHVFVHWWPWHVRVPFANVGNGSYTGIWHAQLVPAVRFAVFDALQYETLHDDAYPYDFNGWLFPYVVSDTP